jgi:hypothetical protein
MAAAHHASVAALAPSASAAASALSASVAASAWLELEFDGNRLLMLDEPRTKVPSPDLVVFMVQMYKEGSNEYKLGLIAFLASMWPQLWTETRFQMAMEIKTIQGRIHLADMQLDFHQDEMDQMPWGQRGGVEKQRQRRHMAIWLTGVKQEQLKDKTHLRMYSGTFREVSKAQAEQRAQDRWNKVITKRLA